MITLEDQLCPWKLSKQIVELGGNSDSYFKWAYLQGDKIEKRSKYIIIGWFDWEHRPIYPAFTSNEILQYLPEGYILGCYCDKWYCKYSMGEWANMLYYDSVIEACAHAYIKMLKEAI